MGRAGRDTMEYTAPMEEPQIPRPPAARPEGEQGVDPDDRRDVAEGDGEILEEIESAPELLLVAQLGEAGGVPPSASATDG